MDTSYCKCNADMLMKRKAGALPILLESRMRGHGWRENTIATEFLVVESHQGRGCSRRRFTVDIRR